MKRLALLLLMLWPATLWADPVVPAEVSGQPGAIVTVPADVPEGSSVAWYAPDPGLSMIPPGLLKDTRTAVVIAPKAGRYRLVMFSANGGSIDGPHVCVVVIGGAPPGPDPGPGPEPGPGPDPGPTPDPPGPAPIPEPGLRVLIVYESAELGELTQDQYAILYGAKCREYLDRVTAIGPDGKTHEWRIWDRDADTRTAPKIWQDVMKRDRAGTPWLVVSNGVTGYEGPLPADAAAFVELVKKYEVK